LLKGNKGKGVGSIIAYSLLLYKPIDGFKTISMLLKPRILNNSLISTI